MAFQKAVKYGAKLRLAISGPSGSGKTFTALALATHLVAGTDQRIALVDTEHGSASKYADLFDFDVDEMDPPFDPRSFVKKIKEAEALGYGVIVVDSLSHAWFGAGGLLEMVDQFTARARTNNKFSAGWKDATPIQNDLVDAIIRADLHVIATMRSKQEHVQEKNERGQTEIKKVGMQPIQRDGMEYEFDILLDMTMDNEAIVMKTRCPAITGGVFRHPGEELATTLKAWLAGEPAPEKPKAEHAGDETLKKRFWGYLKQRLIELGYDPQHFRSILADPDSGLPWAAAVLGAMDRSDWVHALTIDLTPGPAPA